MLPASRREKIVAVNPLGEAAYGDCSSLLPLIPSVGETDDGDSRSSQVDGGDSSL